MIYGIGTDIIELDRVLKYCDREAFYERVFTDNERREALNSKKRLAGDFAVKEAVSKAFGTGVRGFELKEIEVLRDELGKPYVVLHDSALKLSEDLEISRIHVSIADTKENVIAFAVAEKPDVKAGSGGITGIYNG